MSWPTWRPRFGAARSWRGALVLILAALLPRAHAAVAVEEWRGHVAAARALAENDAPRAYLAAQGLEAALPATAPVADRVGLLNLRAHIETCLALTDAATRHARQARDLAERHSDREGQAEALLVESINAVNQGRIDTSFAAAVRAEELLAGVSRPDLMAEASMRASLAYHRLGQLGKSVNTALHALEIAEASNSPRALAYAHLGLGIAYHLSDNFQKADEHYRRMLDSARAADSTLLQAQALHRSGMTAVSLGDHVRAQSAMLAALAMNRRVGAPFAVTTVLAGLADLKARQGWHAEAVSFWDEAIAIYGKYPNPIGLWHALNGRADSLGALGRRDAAAADVQRAHELAAGVDLPDYRKKSLHRLADLAAEAGDHRRAYELARAANTLADEAAKHESATRVVELVRRYEAGGRQRQLDALKARSARQAEVLERQTRERDWLIAALAASAVMLAGTAYFLARLRRKERRIETANARLSMLDFALNRAREAAYITDAEGRIRYVNDEACRALGYSREDLLAMTLSDIDAEPEEIESARRRATRTANGERIMERRHRGRDGRVFPVEIVASPFEYRGQAVSIALARDMTARKAAEREIEASRAQLRGLAAHREEEREAERRHLAREVHDELGQILTGVQLNLSMLAHGCGDESLRQRLRETQRLTGKALAVTRDVVSALRPGALDMDIATALEWLARRFKATAGIPCEVDIDDGGDGEIEADETRTIALFRIAQEALTNIARHAQAGRANITLEVDAADFILRVRDDGVGFDADARETGSFGLLGMRERALNLGGTLVVDSRRGQGTEIVARLPIHDAPLHNEEKA